MKNKPVSGLGQTFSLDRDSRGYPIVALSFQRVNDVGVGLSTETSGIETCVVRYGVASIFALTPPHKKFSNIWRYTKSKDSDRLTQMRRYPGSTKASLFGWQGAPENL